MKLSFFLNMMGVANMKWYEKNNIPYISETKWSRAFNKEITIKDYEKYYYCGRIDVYGHPEYPFNYEYGVSIMEGESWYKFGEWLANLHLDYLPETVEEIYEMFESETSYRIKWWKENE